MLKSQKAGKIFWPFLADLLPDYTTRITMHTSQTDNFGTIQLTKNVLCLIINTKIVK